MKKLALAAAAALALTGCASAPKPLVSDELQQQMSQTNRVRLIEGCPNGKPREQWNILDLIGQHAADGTLDYEASWAAAVDSCTGLTQAQRDAYWVYVQRVRIAYEQLYNQLANSELEYRKAEKRERWARAAQNLQNSGRIMMEIQRTDDLDRIRRGLDDRGY